MADTKKKKIKVTRVINGAEVEVEIDVDDSGGLAWGPNDKHRILNKRIPRADGPAKVTGKAIYAHDARPPGLLFGRVLRSPHAHAKVTKFDPKAARAIPGVMAVVDCNRDVFHEGSIVAAVAATTPEIADDAIRAIVIEYEVFPHVVKVDDAIKPDSPSVKQADRDGSGNIRNREHNGDQDAVNEAFAKCDAIVEAEYRSSTVHHCCLETHGSTVDFRGGDTATVYASTQGTFTIPNDAARGLGLQPKSVTAVVEHMGGGFGSKFGLGTEGDLACRLSRQLKVPVRMMLNRHDEFLVAGNRSGSWQKFKVGVMKDGRIVAMHVEQYRLGGLGGGSQGHQPHLYHVEKVYRETSSIHTHIDSSRAMRAPGAPQAAYAMESLMDEIAYKIGMDPIQLRKLNQGDKVFHRQFDRGAKEIGWERRNPIPGGNTGPLKRGFGCAAGAWGGGGGPQCQVELTIGRDGGVTASVGSQDLGTGTRTFIRAIIAEELGLNVNDIVEKIGNSNLGAANTSGGSTTAASLAPAVKNAAFNARVALANALSGPLGASSEQIAFVDGNVFANGKKTPWKQACSSLPDSGLTAKGVWKAGLSGGGTHGVCFAEVEVDVETGYIKPIKMVHVQDCGLPLNRFGIESQINGGMIQGLGMALYEGRVMDARLGIMLNPGFGDYKLPGSLEMPEMVPIIDDEDTREAVIGIGEPSAIPACGAIQI